VSDFHVIGNRMEQPGPWAHGRTSAEPVWEGEADEGRLYLYRRMSTLLDI